VISVYRFAHSKLFLGISKPLCKLLGLQISYVTGFFQGPTWRKSKAGAVLLANRRYDGSRSRKTKGSLADTFQCNIWRRAQTLRGGGGGGGGGGCACAERWMQM